VVEGLVGEIAAHLDDAPRRDPARRFSVAIVLRQGMISLIFRH